MTREVADLTTNPVEDLEDLALRDDYALDPAYIEMVVDAADRNDGKRLRELVDALRECIELFAVLYVIAYLYNVRTRMAERAPRA